MNDTATTNQAPSPLSFFKDGTAPRNKPSDWKPAVMPEREQDPIDLFFKIFPTLCPVRQYVYNVSRDDILDCYDSRLFDESSLKEVATNLAAWAAQDIIGKRRVDDAAYNVLSNKRPLEQVCMLLDSLYYMTLFTKDILPGSALDSIVRTILDHGSKLETGRWSKTGRLIRARENTRRLRLKENVPLSLPVHEITFCNAATFEVVEYDGRYAFPVHGSAPAPSVLYPAFVKLLNAVQAAHMCELPSHGMDPHAKQEFFEHVIKRLRQRHDQRNEDLIHNPYFISSRDMSELTFAIRKDMGFGGVKTIPVPATKEMCDE